MLKNRPLRYITAAVLAVVGLLFLCVNTDRIYSDLEPTEGESSGIVLQAGHTYQETFPVSRSSLTRLSVFIRPLAGALPQSQVKLAVLRDGKMISQGVISTTAIDTEGASQAAFSPALKTLPNETLILELTVPKELDGRLRVQLRQPDETFKANELQFTIDGKQQSAPLAYQAYASYRPALAVQLSILLLFSAFMVLSLLPINSSYFIALYAVLLSLLTVVPALLLHQVPLMIAGAVIVASSGMWQLLRKEGASALSSAIGTNAFALTTWYALQGMVGRNYLFILALLPYAFLLIKMWWHGEKKKFMSWFVLCLIWIIICLVARHGAEIVHWPSVAANPKDIWFDPNQAPLALKVSDQSLTWDNYGSYIGVISGVLALIGVLFWGRRYKWMLALLIASTAIVLLPHQFEWFPIPVVYLALMPTFFLAYFAARGMESVRRYLGYDRLVTVLLFGVMSIALIDLLYVLATAIEYGKL